MSGAILAISGAIETAALTVGIPAAGGLTGSLIYSGVSIGITSGILAGVGAAFAPKVPAPEALQIPLKQSMPVRKSAFGRVRVSGSYAFFGTGVGTAKALSIDMLALLDGRSNAFISYYLNDDLMAEVGDYWWAPGAPGKYGGGGSNPPNLVQIDSRLGLPTETSYSEIAPALPLWDASHRGDGVTSMALYCKPARREDQSGDFPNGVPTPTAVIDAQLVFDPRDGAQTQGDASTYAYSNNPVLCLLAYLTDASGGMGLNYARFILPAISYWTAAADECDGLISTSGMHATLLDAAAVGDTKIFLADTTGLVVGTVIALPTENVTVTGFGLAGEVDFSGGLLYSHQAGELAYWAASGQAVRYACAGTYGHDSPPGDVIKAILSSFDGWLGQRGDGSLVIRTNAVYTPTVALADRHIVGYQCQHFLPDEQATNQLIVSFTDPASAFNKAEAGYVQDDIDIAQRGQLRSQELYLEWVPSGPQAIGVARAVLARATQPLRGTLTTNLAGLAVMSERYVRIQVSELPALNDLVVEVTGKVTIDLANMQASFPFVATSRVVLGSVQLRVQEVVAKGSLTATLPAAPADGNWLVAFGMLGWANPGPPPGAPPTAAAGWAVLDAHTAATAHSSDPSCAVAYRRAGPGESATQTPFTDGTNTHYSVAIIEVSGVGDDFISVLSSHALGVPATESGASTVTLTTTASSPSTLAIALGGWYAGDPGPGSITLAGSSWTHTVTTSAAVGVAVAGSLTASAVESVTATFAATVTNAYGLCGALLTFGGDGISSTPGSSYTLPPLAPPSGAPLQPLAAPTIASATPDYPASGGGIQGARLLIVVSDEGDVAWKVRWKLAADTSWTEIAVSDPTGSPPELLTGLIAASGTVDVEVAYVTASQVSPWSATTTATVAAPMAAVSDTATATEALAAGNVCYLYTASGAAKVQKANATDLTKPANCFVKAAVLNTAAATVFMPGQYIEGLSLAPGQTYYLHTTGGAITATSPSTSGNGAQIVGVADSSGAKLFFNPQPMTGV